MNQEARMGQQQVKRLGNRHDVASDQWNKTPESVVIMWGPRTEIITCFSEIITALLQQQRCPSRWQWRRL